jgi:acyl carrier protein
MCENKADVISQIVVVITELFPKTKDLLSEKDYNNSLSGQPLYFSGYSLVYLFFELEKRFQIMFSENDLINYRFYTIEQIAERICEKKMCSLSVVKQMEVIV